MTEVRSWLLQVDDDGVITFPDEVLDGLGWEEGDDIYFDPQPDGSIVLSKVNDEIQVDP